MKKTIVIAIILIAIGLTAKSQINEYPPFHFRCRVHPRVYVVVPRLPRVYVTYPVYPVHYRFYPRRHLYYYRHF